MAAKKTEAKTEKPKIKKKKPEKSAEFKTQKLRDFTISRKRSGRFEVVATNGKNINGVEKAKILLDAKLIKTGISKAPAKDAPEPAPAAT